MAAAVGLDAEAERRGFAVAYPDADLGSFDAGPCCNRRKPGDLRFVDAVIRYARRHVGIDQRRIAAVGFSNGGFMAYRLACQRARTFTAIAVVAGAEITRPCRPAAPVSVLHIHGARDTRVSPQGGRFGAASLDETMRRWQERDRCRGWQATTHPGVTVRETARCADGAQVRLVVLPEGGHEWPGAAPPYGTPGGPYPATAEIADFVVRRPRGGSSGTRRGLTRTVAVDSALRRAAGARVGRCPGCHRAQTVRSRALSSARDANAASSAAAVRAMWSTLSAGFTGIRPRTVSPSIRPMTVTIP